MRFGWLAVAAVGFAGCRAVPVPDSSPPSFVGKGAGGLGSSDPTPNPLPQRERGLQPTAGLGSSEPADPLTLVAKCLEQGDHATAATHLGSYVRAHPEQLMFRAHLAEMLLRAGNDTEAAAQFERFVADAQGATGPPKAHLVHCHTRLMEIAGRGGDRFGESFHRGVGLLLLVAEQDRASDRDDGFCEEMLCKAIRALTAAVELRPTDARVQVYLADAYERSGNRRGADVARTAARNLNAPSALTPGESRRLAMGK